jgi:hypothetical protein
MAFAGTSPWVFAQLPAPNELLLTRGSETVAALRGVAFDATSTDGFELLVDTHGAPFATADAVESVRYFRTALALPDTALWVNLSPYEQERVIDEGLSASDLGKVMLEQDYVLKQFASSLTHPESEIGKRYWAAVQAVGKDDGAAALTKVWIVPDNVSLAQDGGSAFIESARLRVLTDVDYQAAKQAAVAPVDPAVLACVRAYVIPAIEKEVNEGALFAPLRRVFSAVVLAAWSKQRLHGSPFSSMFDAGHLSNAYRADRVYKSEVCSLYREGFSRGAYAEARKVVINGRKKKRLYFSGGEELAVKPSSMHMREVVLTRDAMRTMCSAPEHAVSLRVALAGGKNNVSSSLHGEQTLKDIMKKFRVSQSTIGAMKQYLRGEVLLDQVLRHIAADEEDPASVALLIEDYTKAQGMTAARSVMYGTMASEAAKEYTRHLDGITAKLVKNFQTKGEMPARFSPLGWSYVRRIVAGSLQFDALSEVNLSILENSFSATGYFAVLENGNTSQLPTVASKTNLFDPPYTAYQQYHALLSAAKVLAVMPEFMPKDGALMRDVLVRYVSIRSNPMVYDAETIRLAGDDVLFMLDETGLEMQGEFDTKTIMPALDKMVKRQDPGLRFDPLRDMTEQLSLYAPYAAWATYAVLKSHGYPVPIDDPAMHDVFTFKNLTNDELRSELVALLATVIGPQADATLEEKMLQEILSLSSEMFFTGFSFVGQRASALTSSSVSDVSSPAVVDENRHDDRVGGIDLRDGASVTPLPASWWKSVEAVASDASFELLSVSAW